MIWNICNELDFWLKTNNSKRSYPYCKTRFRNKYSEKFQKQSKTANHRFLTRVEIKCSRSVRSFSRLVSFIITMVKIKPTSLRKREQVRTAVQSLLITANLLCAIYSHCFSTLLFYLCLSIYSNLRIQVVFSFIQWNNKGGVMIFNLSRNHVIAFYNHIIASLEDSILLFSLTRVFFQFG